MATSQAVIRGREGRGKELQKLMGRLLETSPFCLSLFNNSPDFKITRYFA
jgi:hypothetical protein